MPADCLRRALRVLQLSVSLFAGVAMPLTPAVAADPLSMQQRADLRARLGTLDAQIYDPNVRFSARQMLADLGQVEALAAADPATAVELRRILLLKGLVEFKRQNVEGARDMYVKALALPAVGAVDVEREARAHYNLAEVASDLGDFAVAVTHYAKAHDHAQGHAAFTDDQRLGMREKRGYVLHEAGRHAEALAVNLGVLAEGERLLGADSIKLKTVLTNIAQNLHVLGRGPEAEPYLSRCLGIARKHGDLDKEQEMMFQLGVLAYEMGKFAEARTWMTDRVRLVIKAGEKAMAARAREDLAELEQKLKGRR